MICVNYMKKDAYLNLGNDVINKKQFREFWLASLRVLRTKRASEIRCFQEIFRGSNVEALMLKVA